MFHPFREVIEENLKKLPSPSTKPNEESETNGEMKPKPESKETPLEKPIETSQTINVINNFKNGDEKVVQPSMESSSSTNVNGDQYDVINGGIPIGSPQLPLDGVKHQVQCMVVSHPGHFYVRFMCTAHDEQLANMNSFYNGDEHIDLSVDVLKSGQYFAAKRNDQWIRVQLLHVESAELINCLLIDEGCFAMFKLSDLQPLYNQFRSVPKQAIRATLSGIIKNSLYKYIG